MTASSVGSLTRNWKNYINSKFVSLFNSDLIDVGYDVDADVTEEDVSWSWDIQTWRYCGQEQNSEDDLHCEVSVFFFNLTFIIIIIKFYFTDSPSDKIFIE